jgi:hypothetical protein
LFGSGVFDKLPVGCECLIFGKYSDPQAAISFQRNQISIGVIAESSLLSLDFILIYVRKVIALLIKPAFFAVDNL